MAIKEFSVKGLFGYFNHTITLNQPEGIGILLGQNGIGKTTVLRILNMLFNHKISMLSEIEFQEAKVTFDDDKFISITSINSKEGLNYELSLNGEFIGVTTCSIIRDQSKTALKSIRDYLQDYNRIDDSTFANKLTGEILCEEEVCYNVSKDLPFTQDFEIYPSWLSNILNSNVVKFIPAQRLSTVSVSQSRSINRSTTESVSTVKIIAKELSNTISKLQQTYTEKAIELDETYPYRLVETLDGISFSKSSVSNQERLIEELSLYRNRLTHAGLLSKSNVDNRKFLNKSKSPYVLRAIDLYVEDSWKKLEVFDDDLTKLELFLNLVNSRLLKKELVVDKEFGLKARVINSVTPFDIDKLSSGEQNLIILYYDLIFKYPKDSLIMIDEPEISLHIAWQKKFIPELKKIIKYNNIHVLIATHSPSLIGRYWGLTQELDKNLD